MSKSGQNEEIIKRTRSQYLYVQGIHLHVPFKKMPHCKAVNLHMENDKASLVDRIKNKRKNVSGRMNREELLSSGKPRVRAITWGSN